MDGWFARPASQAPFWVWEHQAGPVVCRDWKLAGPDSLDNFVCFCCCFALVWWLTDQQPFHFLRSLQFLFRGGTPSHWIQFVDLPMESLTSSGHGGARLSSQHSGAEAGRSLRVHSQPDLQSSRITTATQRSLIFSKTNKKKQTNKQANKRASLSWRLILNQWGDFLPKQDLWAQRPRNIKTCYMQVACQPHHAFSWGPITH